MEAICIFDLFNNYFLIDALATLATFIFILLIVAFWASIIIIPLEHYSRLSPVFIIKRYHKSGRKDAANKAKCKYDIDTLCPSTDLIELKNFYKKELQELRNPGNRSDVIIPLTVSTASLLLSVNALLNNQYSSANSFFCCITVIVLLVAMLYEAKRNKDRQKIAQYYIQAIEEKLESEKNGRSYIVTICEK